MSVSYDRRAFMAYCSSLGIGATLLPGVLWTQLAQGAPITPATVRSAEEIAGVSFTEAQREMMVRNLTTYRQSIDALHKVSLANGVAPALLFDPLPPGATLPPHAPTRPMVRRRVAVRPVPNSLEDLAFLPITALADLVRRRKVTSVDLTRMYLDRLRRYDPTLKCVITLTEERALRQARAADEEIARGRYRGALHGIPWGAKDLLAVKGYKTTWGAGPYKEQVIDADATVVQRLDAAGAVLVAKLTLGELAQGDVWFGGVTRNPWWPAQGSSGSSAGPASATAAGLVGFSIGTETQGSISSPSTRCGVSGLRPTFGRVPRTGAMALSWSMDKIGPICRSAEDCALVFDAIHGPDGQDRTIRDVAFHWNATLPLARIRVGYVKSAFDAPESDPATPSRSLHPTKPLDDAALEVLRRQGIRLVPVELPDVNPQAMSLILTAEAAAAFDELTRSGRVDQMVQQNPGAWPNTFRAAQFIPAVDYINANRVRALAIQKWWELFQTVDVIVVPTSVQGSTSGASQLPVTNLTGNPAVIVPHGFQEAPPLGPGTAAGVPFGSGAADRRAGVPANPAVAPDTGRQEQPVQSPRPLTPRSITFLGALFGEAKALRVADAFQAATDWHTRTPPLAG